MPLRHMLKMSRIMRLLFLVAPVIASACSNPADQSPSAKTPVSSSQSPPSAVAHVLACSQDGTPLPGMIPIVTVQPNAFQEPLARGELTDARGRGSIVIPTDQTVYVRTWDPTLHYFANNYFEVLPAEGSSTEEMAITMLRAGCLAMTLIGADGQPAANQNTGLMMFHPYQGPWWPGEADSDDQGHVRFAPVPPGNYNIKVKAIQSGMADVADVMILPGETVDLGMVRLQSSAESTAP